MILGLLVLGLLSYAAYHAWGHMDFDDPWVTIEPPVDVVGVKTDLLAKAGDKTSGLKQVRITFTQGTSEKVVLDRVFPPGGDPGETVELPFSLEPRALGFQEGKAILSIKVRERPWMPLLRGRTAGLTREVLVDLVPITVAFQKASYLLIAGGTGVVCYRLNKPARESGVRIGDTLYKGYPNPRGGQGDYTVLFPLPRDARGPFQVELVAQAFAGATETKQVVTLKAKPRKWRTDQIDLSDDFILKMAGTFSVPVSEDLVNTFLQINRDMRGKNHDLFRRVCLQSSPQPLWSGAFTRFLGKWMARFGDKRTYVYKGKAIDEQVHQGEDLASLEQSPVEAGNSGVVVLAEPLGIYGLTVILDHGMGVFSSYSHLSQIDAKVGDKLEKGAVLGKTGTTGLAGGDHLHFSILLQGTFVNPLEWWDPHWLKDQVEEVWIMAGSPPTKPSPSDAAGTH